jgi:hypothetical protein
VWESFQIFLVGEFWARWVASTEKGKLGKALAIDIGIEVLAPRQGDVANHFEGGREHLADKFSIASAS